MTSYLYLYLQNVAACPCLALKFCLLIRTGLQACHYVYYLTALYICDAHDLIAIGTLILVYWIALKKGT